MTTLKELIMIHVCAEGPVTFNSILRYAKDQWNKPDRTDICDWDMVPVMNELLHAGLLELYDTGDSFIVTEKYVAWKKEEEEEKERDLHDELDKISCPKCGSEKMLARCNPGYHQCFSCGYVFEKTKKLDNEKAFVCLRGIEAGNRFFTTNTPGGDPTKLTSGEVVYTILGYADTTEEAQMILYGTTFN